MFRKPVSVGGMLVLFLALLLGSSALWAGEKQASEKLQAAIRSYNSANFDAAIEQLKEIAYDPAIAPEQRREALLYLGRCYVARRMMDEARQAIRQLLELEPPPVELDPDREAPPLLRIYYEERKRKSGGSLELEGKNPGIKTLAIMDFYNRSITDKEKYDPMEKGFADILIHRLNGATSLKVVERERLQWILDELEIQDRYHMEGAVRAGKLLGVHAVVFGSFILAGEELWLSARVVKVETGEILLTEEIRGEVGKFFDLTEKLSEKIRQAIEEKIDYSQTEPGPTAPNSLEAMMAYSEGLALLEKGDYDGAYEKFHQALKYDPGYVRAREKAESIKYLLAYTATNNAN